jgi:hypothetical protein
MVRQHTLTAKTRFHDVRFFRTADDIEVLLVACEDGRVRVFPLPAAVDAAEEASALRCSAELTGHTRRCAGRLLL